MKQYIFALLMIASLACNAQQDPQYSQYMFNLVNVNPGYVGSRNVLSLVGIHRHQWSGVDGAPRTSTFSADMPVLQNKAGVGISVVNDAIGRFHNNTVNAMASYRLATDSKGVLGMGLSAGIKFFQADLASIRANPQGTSETLFQDYSKTYAALGAGFFYTRDTWYLGLSAPSLLKSIESVNETNNGLFRKSQHLFFTGGYVLGLSSEVKLKPSFMLRGAMNAPLSLDVNANLWFHDVIGIGASYRISNAFVALLEIQANRNFRFGYAADFTTSGMKNEKGNMPLTHEFLLRYEFGSQKTQGLSPRYF